MILPIPKQIVTLTYPHIGNTGANTEDMESNSVFCTGLVIRDLPRLHSNFRAEQSLDEFLVANKCGRYRRYRYTCLNTASQGDMVRRMAALWLVQISTLTQR